MAEWIAFLLVAGVATLFTICAGLALVVGPSVSSDRWWMAPVIVFGLLAWGAWSSAIEIAPFTVQEVPR